MATTSSDIVAISPSPPVFNSITVSHSYFCAAVWWSPARGQLAPMIIADELLSSSFISSALLFG